MRLIEDGCLPVHAILSQSVQGGPRSRQLPLRSTWMRSGDLHPHLRTAGGVVPRQRFDSGEETRRALGPSGQAGIESVTGARLPRSNSGPWRQMVGFLPSLPACFFDREPRARQGLNRDSERYRGRRFAIAPCHPGCRKSWSRRSKSGYRTVVDNRKPRAGRSKWMATNLPGREGWL